MAQLFKGTALKPGFEPAFLYAFTYSPQRMPVYAKQLLAHAAGRGATTLPTVPEILQELAAAQVHQIKLGFVVARRDAPGRSQRYPKKSPLPLKPFQARYGPP